MAAFWSCTVAFSSAELCKTISIRALMIKLAASPWLAVPELNAGV